VISRRLIAWLPNLITLARILAVPVIVYVMLFGYYTAALWIFVAAAVTDALDGAIAKQFSVESEVGAFLDPLADKALLLGVYGLLGYTGHIATWLVILVVFRDFLIIAGAIMFHTITHSLKMEPLLVSKVNTLTQILLASLVLVELGLEFDLAGVVDLLVYVVAATTFISGAAYVTKWGILAATMEREP
jgi:cardiolipin synthase